MGEETEAHVTGQNAKDDAGNAGEKWFKLIGDCFCVCRKMDLQKDVRHTRTHARTYTLTHTRTHSRTHARARTHTHTHTLSRTA